ncbi:bifunctional glycosyltransferase/CDP-glycerol:glycerophosphate glycerophosphotransferase [Staphylococcus kloosii]|uniref:Teichoic acid biosynthesis protein F n=2 Tax=Staphylococcus kloosii TaxID=29384 RepID=A0ABQ0XIG4_9STAP|nr:CDP-glycerol:glycerophosphate glycerophosphotransferase [Staphylococcus kloosii]AVQ37071.1 CDP-glycerol:glycerophosphate glycerophosphotransferase [Staphylococcus kloosii]PNZ05803.1 teichoic acid biosynthesis protein F [Staphylococcus kloosii]GEP81248.1 teichoic acid biosynthesis protein F [Staphylococcus kloosii]SUM47995.1 teichoic acid biosynthesis protein F [Staphylococcus kloosii]
MKFSIVIPYKEKGNEKFLENCIDSLCQQTYKNFEVIFIHNNSNKLLSLIKNIDLNVHEFKMNETNTLSDYRNTGIERAKGEYVIFLDADDYIHSNALSYASEMIKDRPEDSVFKFGIAKTNLDKVSTLNKSKKAFFENEAQAKLESVLTDANIKVNEEQVKDVIDGLFKNQIINHSYTKIKRNKFLSAINYKFKVHGFIIKRDFIIDNYLYFKSSNNLYTDIPFLIRLYNKTENINQTTTKLYYKYLHNDPINMPSLTQEEHNDRLFKRLSAINEAIQICEDQKLAKQLKLTAINYYLYKVVKSNVFIESYPQTHKIYIELKSILNSPSVNINLNQRHSYEINAIKKGHFKKAYALSKTRVLGYKTYQFMKPKNKRFRQKKVQKNIFTKLPIKEDTIIYESFLGKNYSDSPKSIFKYLLDNSEKKWKHVWVLNNKDVVKDEEEFENNNVKIIKRFSWQYFYYVTVSKYFILNMRQPKWLYKKSEQVILSTWHGTPLKKLVFDMENVTSANKHYKKDFYYQSRNWDYLIAANKYSEKIFESAFMYPKENILTYGYPRNDILTNHSSLYKKQIKEKLELPQSKKVILYAPTWRDDEFHSVGKYKFKLQLDLDRLKEELGNEYVIALRMHYFISDNIDLTDYKGFAYDFSKYNDINDLYIVSDLLITDYSSVFFDYSILRKPILFYTYDLEKYQNMLRGFYIDVNKDLPGPLLLSNDEVLDSIKNIDRVNKEYKEKYEEFHSKYCYLEDGKASQRVVEKVLK